jgi:hypothetical protein
MESGSGGGHTSFPDVELNSAIDSADKQMVLMSKSEMKPEREVL